MGQQKMKNERGLGHKMKPFGVGIVPIVNAKRALTQEELNKYKENKVIQRRLRYLSKKDRAFINWLMKHHPRKALNFLKAISNVNSKKELFRIVDNYKHMYYETYKKDVIGAVKKGKNKEQNILLREYANGGGIFNFVKGKKQNPDIYAVIGGVTGAVSQNTKNSLTTKKQKNQKKGANNLMNKYLGGDKKQNKQLPDKNKVNTRPTSIKEAITNAIKNGKGGSEGKTKKNEVPKLWWQYELNDKKLKEVLNLKIIPNEGNVSRIYRWMILNAEKLGINRDKLIENTSKLGGVKRLCRLVRNEIRTDKTTVGRMVATIRRITGGA